MKHILLILLFIGFTSSCIRDDDDDSCNDTNTSLLFTYTGDGDIDIFPLKIERVHLYLFGQDNKQVEQLILEKNQLTSYQGVKLNLPEGLYHIICWGNVFDKTSVKGSDEQTSEISSPEYYAQQPVTTNDSLYFAYHSLEVKPYGEGTDTVRFLGAHINFNVYLHGYYASQQIENIYHIRINNLPPAYDFKKQNKYNPVSYYPVGVNNPNSKIYSYKFNILQIKDNNAVTIDLIETQSGKIAYTLPLKEYMGKYNIHVDNKNEAAITVHFSISEIGVSVLPWENENIYPEL